MNEQQFDPAIKLKARLAGALYLLCIGSGFCAEFFVRGRLVDYADAAKTASQIAAFPVLYRMGFLADLVSFTTGIVVGVLFFQFFRPISGTVARLALSFCLVSNTVSLASAIFYVAPVHMLAQGAYPGAFSAAQLAALTVLSLKLYQFAFSINLGLFAIDCFATAYLIFNSHFLPRLLGILLALGGACYLTNSVAYFLPPDTLPNLYPFIYLPSVVAELSLASWLTFAGINSERWHAVANVRRSAVLAV